VDAGQASHGRDQETPHGSRAIPPPYLVAPLASEMDTPGTEVGRERSGIRRGRWGVHEGNTWAA